ncbi:hypothetical protein MtrunA17_Chr3g0082081 [Medicago truncatula]|uniref:Uncharacterized protein n=1 Tax=Medicago truncatula TaxID=3880 RepID=A0A396IMQ8_MEDTR|nr:hypothetical protein MtrunA17_Chr3g0082081 [Medicago truncatula]
MKKTFPTTNHRTTTRHDSYLRRQPPWRADHHWNPRFQSNHLYYRPRLPYFIVNLRLTHRLNLRREEIETLIADCKPNPDKFSFQPNESITASLNFNNGTDAISAVVWFWESRLSECRHELSPEFIEMNSDNSKHGDELKARLRSVFMSHVKELMEGKEINRWIKEWDRLSKEIKEVNSLLGKPFPVRVQDENIDRKKMLDGEKNLVEKRLKEFEYAMENILMYLEENNNNNDDDDDVNVIRFGERFDWEKICNFIVRERRRLEDGLPIYAYRKEILQQIYHQQVPYISSIQA